MLRQLKIVAASSALFKPMGGKQRNSSFIVGITGSTGSGKTTFAKKLIQALGDQAVLLSSDMYYKDQSHLPLKKRLKSNMDRPEAFDNKLLVEHIEKLAQGQEIGTPIYNFVDHTRKKEREVLIPRPIVIVEGLLVFATKRLRDLFDLKIFMEVDADIRVIRRILRDVAERRDGSLEAAIRQYLNSARPMDKVYVAPQKKYADLTISWNEADPAEVARVAKLIKEKIAKK